MNDRRLYSQGATASGSQVSVGCLRLCGPLHSSSSIFICGIPSPWLRRRELEYMDSRRINSANNPFRRLSRINSNLSTPQPHERCSFIPLTESMGGRPNLQILARLDQGFFSSTLDALVGRDDLQPETARSKEGYDADNVAAVYCLQWHQIKR